MTLWGEEEQRNECALPLAAKRRLSKNLAENFFDRAAGEV